MTSPVAVKVCGLRRAADAASAVAAGASYLGIVFAAGPRRATIAEAREVIAAAEGVPVVAVFGTQPAADIAWLSGRLALRGAQLHGEYSAADAALIRGEGVLVWRVERLATADDLERLSETVREADAVLVEPRVAGVLGGTGVALADELGVAARARLRGRRMVLAGGLRPETVAAAIALVQPEVVDVSSGVEREPGIKDPQKIARFLEAALGHTANS